MAKGRSAKPAVLLDNETRKCPKDEAKARFSNEPQMEFSVRMCRPNAILNDVGKKKWKEVIKLHKSMANSPLSDADYDSLTNYCLAFQQLILATEELTADSSTFIVIDGKSVRNPAFKMQMDAMNMMKKYEADLCLSATGRAKVGLARKKADDKSPLAQARAIRGKERR